MDVLCFAANDIENVQKNLSKIPHATVYRRKDIPDRFHYKNHERAGDLLLLFEPGYEMVHKPIRKNRIFVDFVLSCK